VTVLAACVELIEESRCTVIVVLKVVDFYLGTKQPLSSADDTINSSPLEL